MKAFSAVLGALMLLLLAAFFLEQNKIAALQAEMIAAAQDRENTTAELRKLTARVTDLQTQLMALASAARSTPSSAAAAEAATPAARAANAPVAAPALAPIARPGVTVSAPAGWNKNGAKAEHYAVGVDSTQTWGGMASAYVESLTPTVDGGFGGMMQTTAAESYAGKRVRLSGWIKTENANEGGGHLWMRIDGQERGQMLGFDNMDNRPMKGTGDWQEASVVLDVPAGASSLNYGFFVQGGGKMWVNGQRIEEVGRDVPTTNMLNQAQKAPPPAPRNLGFDPSKPK